MWKHDALRFLGLAALQFACSPARSPEPVSASLDTARPVVRKYCAPCHSPNGEASELNWSYDLALIAHRRGIAAKVRLNSMPPPGLPRPDANERRVLLCWALSNSDGCGK